MENTMSNGKMNDRKVRALNENVSPLKIELDDKRVRYFQSTTASPGLPQPYRENDGSPARYFFAGSPVSRKAGEAFTPPTFGASKYRSAKTYSGTSSGNSSFSSRGRLSLSPLSSIENLEISSHTPSPMYRTPVKVDEEVLVMDDIQVRHVSGGKSGRSSSSSSGRSSSSSKSTFKTEICRSWEESGNCRYNSKCQVLSKSNNHSRVTNIISMGSFMVGEATFRIKIEESRSGKGVVREGEFDGERVEGEAKGDRRKGGASGEERGGKEDEPAVTYLKHITCCRGPLKYHKLHRVNIVKSN